MLRLRILSACFLGLFAAQAGATIFYVDNNGSDSRACSQAQDPAGAKSSIASAMTCVQPGDTIYVRNGLYAGYDFNDVHGRSDAWITVKSYPGERATIDYTQLHGGQGFGFVNSNYIEIADMEITTPGYFQPSNSCDVFDAACQRANRPCDTTDRNCQMQYAELGGANGVWSHQAVYFTGSNHLIIRNMEIHNLNGFGFFGGKVPEEGPGTGIQILNNHIHHLGIKGFFNANYCTYVVGADYVIRGNICHDSPGSDGMRIGTAYEGAEGELRNSLIENNISYNNGGEINYVYWDGSTIHSNGVGFAGAGFTFNGAGHNNIIRNNIAYRNGSGGFAFCGPTSGELHIYNNVSYGNGYIGMGSSCGDRSTVYNNLSFNNNALYGSGYDFAFWNGGQPTLVNNIYGTIYTDDSSNATLQNNIVGADPGFVDPGNGDFHLRSSSPAINAGVDLSAFGSSTDFEGNSRESGAWDIGAFEFGGESDPPGDTSAPTISITSPAEGSVVNRLTR